MLHLSSMYKTVRLLKYISAIQVDLSPPLKKWGIFLLNNNEPQNYLYHFIIYLFLSISVEGKGLPLLRNEYL